MSDPPSRAGFTYRPFPAEREVVLDFMRLGERKHLTHGLIASGGRRAPLVHRLHGCKPGASGAGWGIGAPTLHSLAVLVGGIARRPGPDGGSAREVVSVTVSFDHDVVDGGPATRFARRFTELVETAAALQDPSV